jgi:hypothetical protein
MSARRPAISRLALYRWKIPAFIFAGESEFPDGAHAGPE